MQYEINEEGWTDFAIQLDQKDFPKNIKHTDIQTDHVEIIDPEEEALKALLKPIF